MISFIVFMLLLSLLMLNCVQRVTSELTEYGRVEDGYKEPTVMVALLVRNKAHSLPHFLHYLQALDYPKDRIKIWIRSDHNSDNSIEILDNWVKKAKTMYNEVDFQYDKTTKEFYDEETNIHWSDERFKHIIYLRQEALIAAKKSWAHYLFVTDVDNILVNDQTLKRLVHQRKSIIAPMLNCTVAEFYSNFWGGMDENGYYKREPEYFPILYRHEQGVHAVPMVHSTVLIDMNHQLSDQLAYDPPAPHYTGPFDDMIRFAYSAKHLNIGMFILNDDFYGWIPQPLEPPNTLKDEQEQFLHIKTEHMVWFEHKLGKLDYLWDLVDKPKPNKLGFDQIYMINLERRPDRRNKMLGCFDELSIEYKWIPAMDGRQLNDTYLSNLGVKMLSGFADPYHNRALTLGEIGCFLSHYFIWQDMIENNYESVIVFEDDIRFEPYFRSKLGELMKETSQYQQNWEMIYLGRKKLKYQEEVWVPGAEMLVWAHYSYWTLGYIMHLNGAKKLLEQNPLPKMVPVDEYLPIMFDKHPSAEYKERFSPRNLNCLSVEPLLVFPTHYTGEPGYFTDTEESSVIGESGAPATPLIPPADTEQHGYDNHNHYDYYENVNLRGDVGDREEL